MGARTDDGSVRRATVAAVAVPVPSIDPRPRACEAASRASPGGEKAREQREQEEGRDGQGPRSDSIKRRRGVCSLAPSNFGSERGTVDQFFYCFLRASLPGSHRLRDEGFWSCESRIDAVDGFRDLVRARCFRQAPARFIPRARSVGASTRRNYKCALYTILEQPA